MNPEKIRKVYAPYSTTGEQVGQTPLTGYVDVAQAIYPAVNTGQVSTDGEWSGVTVSDKNFFIDITHEGIANGGDALSPQTANRDFIDMTGFKDIFIALKPTNGGTYQLKAVMGPDTNTFANLTPVNGATDLKGAVRQSDFNNLLVDGGDSMTANVWNIFYIQNSLVGQKNMQFKITNNSGGNSDIQFAFLRVV